MRSMGGAITTIMCNLFDESETNWPPLSLMRMLWWSEETTVRVQCSLKVLYCCLSLKG
jgi:hypothetical protein